MAQYPNSIIRSYAEEVWYETDKSMYDQYAEEQYWKEQEEE